MLSAPSPMDRDTQLQPPPSVKPATPTSGHPPPATITPVPSSAGYRSAHRTPICTVTVMACQSNDLRHTKNKIEGHLLVTDPSERREVQHPASA